MAIFSRVDKYQKYKYIVKNLKILLPDGKGEIELHPSKLIQIDLEENYEEYFFPLFKITMSLDTDTYYKLLSNKNKAQFYLRINKAFTDENDSPDLSIEKEFINDTYDIIFDENTGDMQLALKNEDNKDDYTKTRKSTQDSLSAVSDNMCVFYLFKSYVAGTKENVNKVFSNINVTDAIAYLMTVAKIDNVLMAQPDNNTVYKEFLLPPQSVLKSLSFIDSYYGIYKEGSIIYFGLDYTYIIPYNGKCVAYYQNENTDTSIIIPKSYASDYGNRIGSFSKLSEPTKNYIIADYRTININNQSISNNYINANSVYSIDSYDGDDDEEVESKAESKTDENFTRYITNNTENQYLASTYTAQTNAASDVITIRVMDFDINAIAPNKSIKLIFEDTAYTSEYNGEYILSGMNSSFRSSGDQLAVSSTIVLKKVIKSQ